ncbi:N-acetylmannosaminyltransferase [Gordoniibacillus kamchatkensis]|uniref:N-acetylglucosaminyldiphosphoundecaprenol N-acetyl-beta-D-mannosaminyltransferase n=1 Tax=Gordoniibacillus kamchatkensis TaxID=1590651 RepID=A0ABR5AHZ0_9BACL|nr:WecB/TagA/CpsF family glycosyltransferase [Paenibacillus sp. VKM B-2647]KIL40637.1 N-acetylmannosaminyltransferase [Paenibacillus sp. VKM B-2647]
MTMAPIPTVSIYGVRVSRLNMRQTVDYLTETIERGVPQQVVTANPIILMAGLDNSSFMQTLREAELVVPDGTGLVWAASHIGQPVAERVAGYDLIHELMKVGSPRGWKVYLLGAAPGIAEAAAEKLESLYPGIRIVGCRDGFFPASEDDDVIADVTAAAPHLLLVARATNNQDPWIGKYKDRLRVPVMMGVGGSFDVLAGRVKRAPLFFQRLRLEWLYRLLREPSRLPRMLVLPKFVLKVLRDKENVSK